MATLPRMYNPGPYDWLFQRSLFIQGVHAKYGLHVTLNSALSGTCKSIQERQREEHLKGMRIVTDLTKGLKGCNVTCDNFFTSYQLEVELRKRKLPVLGTIIKDKGVLPQELSVMCGRQRYLSIFAFSVEALLISYCPKKNKKVLLMSMMHKDLATQRNKQHVNFIHPTDNKTSSTCIFCQKYMCEKRTASFCTNCITTIKIVSLTKLLHLIVLYGAHFFSIK
ncbi:hypothetical protein T03_3884 [Trichinella britovi]|uniref:PiggyBac transposable element-derived protein domain-containing protein n=1 Tax=Trichinella britovi TaxID=45882 RepID=A0A0V1DAY6_TRIBR|nr:hypothetical protein T03_3884 [Trichinella britovi]